MPFPLLERPSLLSERVNDNRATRVDAGRTAESDAGAEHANRSSPADDARCPGRL